jgi:hypothetical protein
MPLGADPANETPPKALAGITSIRGDRCVAKVTFLARCLNLIKNFLKHAGLLRAMVDRIA